MSEEKYYCNGVDEITYHKTAEEAKAKAEEELQWCRDEAIDGWPDETIWIHWGEIKQVVVETRRLDKEGCEKEGIEFRDNWDCYVEYDLVDTEGRKG